MSGTARNDGYGNPDPVFCPVPYEDRLEDATSEQISYLRRWYAKKGIAWTAAHLGMTYNQTRRLALRLGLSAIDCSNDVEITIKDLAVALDKNTRSFRTFLWNKAKKEKVLRVGVSAATVPHWWAQRLIDANQDRIKENECQKAGYYTVKQASAFLGISPNALKASLPKVDEKGQRIKGYTGTVGRAIEEMVNDNRFRLFMLYPNGYTSLFKAYFNPWDLVELKKKLTPPEGYIPLKKVLIDHGLTRSATHRYFKDRVFYVPTSGGRTAYVPPLTAEELALLRRRSAIHGKGLSVVFLPNYKGPMPDAAD